LAVSFPAIDACEQNGIPFAIAINEFDGVSRHRSQEVREAVAVDARVPVLTVDARDPQSIRGALSTLLESAARHAAAATTGEPDHNGETVGDGAGPSLPD
jgi:signal recognition particle receptor subunit beta